MVHSSASSGTAADTRRRRHRVIYIATPLAAITTLSACTGPNEDISLPLQSWWLSLDVWRDGDDVPGRASSLLLTLAQVNSTILAFIFSLGLVTSQLAARFAIPKLRLSWRNIVFLLLYTVVGVIVPLLWSLQPSAVAAGTLTAVSFAFIVATPISVKYAAKAGSPLELARMAYRDARPRRHSKRQYRRRLADAHATFIGIRNGSAQNYIRDQVQLYLQQVLLEALDAKEEEAAADIASSVVGAVDDGAERRLRQFQSWFVAHGDALSASAPASRATWLAIGRICLRADGDRIDLAEQATHLAATVAAGRVRALSQRPQLSEEFDEVAELVVQEHTSTSTEMHSFVQDVQKLALLVAERVPSAQRGRPLFEAVCTLLTKPLRQVSLGDDYLLKSPFKTASELLRGPLSEGLRKDGPEDAEAHNRMKALCDVPMQLLEAAQASGCLHGDAGRTILRGYLKWVEDAAVNGSVEQIQTLIGTLESRVRKDFLVERYSRRTAAARISLIALEVAVTPQLAATVARVQQLYAETEGWGADSRHAFDFLRWGKDSDNAVVARRFLPLLDQEIWSKRFKEGRENRGENLEMLSVHGLDVLSSWLMPHTRPDVLLSVLLSRWQRALAEDYRRPILREQRIAAKDVQQPESGDIKLQEATREQPEQPKKPVILEHEAESLRVLQIARELLRSSTNNRAWGSGVAAITLDGWCNAVSLWLQAAKGADEPDIPGLTATIEALSSEPSRVTRDLRQPIEIDTSGFSANKDLWQTVFGYCTPNDRMAFRGTRYKRSDLPSRTYRLLPEWEDDTSGYVVAIEEDRSRRLLMLENENGSCEEKTPFSRRYLPKLILEDCLGDLLNCTTCFGLLAGSQWSQLSCPSCAGKGRLPHEELLYEITYDFIVSLPRIGSAPPNPYFRNHRGLHEPPDFGVREFTSRNLREHLANVVEGLGHGPA